MVHGLDRQDDPLLLWGSISISTIGRYNVLMIVLSKDSRRSVLLLGCASEEKGSIKLELFWDLENKATLVSGVGCFCFCDTPNTLMVK